MRAEQVYDLTAFARRHPGGTEVLRLAAGRDVTQVFEMYHPLATHDLLPKFYVGDLVTNELPVFPAMGSFYRTLRERVDEYFKRTNQDPKFAPAMMVRYFMVLALALLSLYVQAYLLRHHTVAQFLMGVPCGILLALVAMLILHDASHFSITHWPVMWRVFGAMHDFVNGSSYLIWLYQHTLGHHPYTNIDDADPDVMTNDPDIRRIKATQPWLARYIGQHIYVPLIYAFLAIKTRIQDFVIVFSARMDGSIRVNDFSRGQMTVFLAGKLCFVAVRIGLPLLFMPAWKVIGLLCINDFVMSYWLALLFQVNHVVTDVAWPRPDSNNCVAMDWAELQVLTTQDYAHDSRLANFLTGALNHQISHHLFPGISQYYYPQIAPIVVRTIKEFGLPFHYKASYLEALGTHIGLLRALGTQPDAAPTKRVL